MGLTWKERAFTALLGAAAVSGLTTLILFLVEATNVLLPADTKFGIVFDAGSSHTSLFVYQWLANKENDTGVVSQALACRAKGPGISSYASDPAQAGESLQGCLEEALALIPKAKRQQTPMFLGATGGMRLLSQKNSSQVEDVFAAVSQALSRSPVAFWGAELLAGQDEGALVLLLRRMDPASGGDVGGRPGHGWGLRPDHLCAWGPHPGHHHPGHPPPLWHRTQRLHPQLPLLRARPDAEPAPGRAGAEQPEPPGASPLLPQRLPGHAGPGPPVRVALRPGRSPPRPRPEPHCGGDGEPRGLCRRHPGSLQLLQLRRPRRLRLRQRLPAPRAGTVLRLLQLLPHLPLPEPHLQAAAGHGQCHHLGVLPEALEAGGGELARAGRPAARLLCLGPVHPHTPARGLRVQPGDLGRHRVPRAGRWHRHRLDAGLHAEPDQPDPSRGTRPVAGTELWRLGGRSRLFGADPHGHSRGHCGAALAPGLGWLPPGAGRQRPELAGAFLSPDPQGSPCGLWPRGHMAPFCHWGHSGHRGCTVAPTMAFRCRRPSRFPMLHEGWAIATPAALRAV
ncbi:ectonucleoside triphosphate diphosphohydrolase 8 isoform X3 [Delphinus delphis]|uniref:ectonucleoside triphosphate diphosphohydrolase 8 isoform X3 n=1 Tax=Delphinus delphis TaxID=9728 RepID=UPI0028C50CB7|nr:ectonucleoside triphosphate diphosphohydrolase 8 isoform X3 [Delphinus delphis]